MRRMYVCSIAAFVSLASGAVDAQSWRAELAFLDTWRPGVAVAYEWRTPIGGDPPLPDPEAPGPIFADVRDWLFTVMAGGGITFARVDDESISPTALAQAGVLRRLDGGFEPRVGLLLFGGVQPDVLGPMLRFEAKDVIGLQAGWVWFGAGESGLAVTVDVAIALLSDLRK
jgi:hypothetical protein